MPRDLRARIAPERSPATVVDERGDVEHDEFRAPSIRPITLGGDLLGYVAIDSTVRGRARGGLRMISDVSEEEIRAAARSMTLKYGLLGLPQGGAKAGVRGDGEAPTEAKRERLLAFARATKPLLQSEAYLPDADLGTRADDIRWMMKAVGLRVGPHDWRSGRSGFYTAVSCLASAETALAYRGTAIAGKRVAIEGFGSVGSALADLLDRRGAIVVAISTSRGALVRSDGLDVRRLLRLATEAGSRVIELYGEATLLPREMLLEQSVDVLCPCARYHSVDEANAPRVKAWLVCSGANDPLSPVAERVLLQRRATVVPDFVSNCGGVLGGTLEYAGVPRARIPTLIERSLAPMVHRLMAQAERRGVSVRAIAEPLALARHAQSQREAERPSLATRAISLGVAAYRRGWVPQALVSRLAPGYVERQLRAS